MELGTIGTLTTGRTVYLILPLTVFKDPASGTSDSLTAGEVLDGGVDLVSDIAQADREVTQELLQNSAQPQAAFPLLAAVLLVLALL